MHVRVKLGRIRAEDTMTAPEIAQKARPGSAIGTKTGTPKWVPILAPSIERLLNWVPFLGAQIGPLFWDQFFKFWAQEKEIVLKSDCVFKRKR